MKIHVLDEATIQKIAAGEVIERPASVIKEMIENSIDAGSTAITVEIKDGGKSMIRVTDNGSGIELLDIKNAFVRHATSKIDDANDLVSIGTLGFRGEALYSISAVARVELITKTRNDITGNRYLIEGGLEGNLSEIGAPDGTTIIVRDLFYNTPVRCKFLKSAQTESGYVQDVVERIALSHPDISFTFITGSVTKLHTSGNGNEKNIIYAIYGKDIASRIIEVDRQYNGIKISGYISKPQIARSNRNYESYYINGRYMKSKLIAKAIDEAYKPYIMGHMFPFTAFKISMDAVLVDVNVHPTKMEVRFVNPDEVYAAILTALSEALSSKNLVSEEKLDGNRINKVSTLPNNPAPMPFEKSKLDAIKQYVASDSPYQRMYPQNNSTDNIKEKRIEEPLNEKIFDNKEVVPVSFEQIELDIKPENINPLSNDIKVIGQLFSTYWLIEDITEQKFYMVDQHAAHEKVNFERMMKAFENRSYYSQQLLVPIIVTINGIEKAALDDNLDEFTKLGFEIDEFSDNEVKISAVPDNIYGIDPKDFFEILLSDMTSDGRSTNELLWNKIATAACKASIKGGWQINEIEVKALIEELLTLDNPFNCPHGRPTMIAMSKAEIERRFRRIV